MGYPKSVTRSSTQLALPAEMGGHGFSSESVLAFPAFLAQLSVRIRATVAEDLNGVRGLSFFLGTKSVDRFSRHATLNSLIKQTLRSLNWPSTIEPRGLYRTNDKRSDGVTMIPWEIGLTGCLECHGCGCSCSQSPESRLLMQPGNHRP